MGLVDKDLRKTLARARSLGCQIEWLHRTGELMVSHASLARRVRLNGRRKDAPDRLLTFLARIERRRV